MKTLLRVALFCGLCFCLPWLALAVWVAVLHFA